MRYRVLVINPTSTSTIIGVFDNENCLFEKTIRHPQEDMSNYNRLTDQCNFRKDKILDELTLQGINRSKFDAVCGRGGLLRPIEGGTYKVNEAMLEDLRIGYNGQHASNLGGILAHEIARRLHIPSYIVDPVVVDEMEPIARATGIPDIARISIFHALNQKSVARQTAKDLDKSYHDINLIITHMGGGITVGAHQKGQVIDVNNGLHGDGPFSPERAGTIPAGDLVSACFSGEYTRQEIMNKIIGEGGMKAYLNTDDIEEVETRMKQGDKRAEFVYQAMAYQIAKEIGAMAAVLQGEIDAVVLTGNLAYRRKFVSLISKRVDWIADVMIYPGENELLALAQGTLRVLRKEEEPKQYIVS